MMTLQRTLGVIHVQVGMILTIIQDHMAVMVAIMMMILMLQYNAVYVREQNHLVMMALYMFRARIMKNWTRLKHLLLQTRIGIQHHQVILLVKIVVVLDRILAVTMYVSVVL
jgi:hypothetical protein